MNKTDKRWTKLTRNEQNWPQMNKTDNKWPKMNKTDQKWTQTDQKLINWTKLNTNYNKVTQSWLNSTNRISYKSILQQIGKLPSNNTETCYIRTIKPPSASPNLLSVISWIHLPSYYFCQFSFEKYTMYIQRNVEWKKKNEK